MSTRAYACYNKNEEMRAKSSSGGVYYLLAENVLENGGIVYAACYDGLKVKHKRIEDKKSLCESLGSKYIPSDLGNTFACIVEDLSAGKRVLFAGLPCQCGGLLAYINARQIECAKLITVDLVCHGVPSEKAWNMYCRSLKSSGFDVKSVNMRDKSNGWSNYRYSMRLNDGKKSLAERNDKNIYLIGYAANIYLRPSCTVCRFNGIERSTDITLGDYWGVQYIQPEMDDDKGTTLVLIHTEAGARLFDKISAQTVTAEAPIERAVTHNPSITTSTQASNDRSAFFERTAAGEDFHSVVFALTKKLRRERTYLRTKDAVKRLIRRK